LHFHIEAVHFFYQAELFEKISKSLDWLEKIVPKNGHFFFVM